MIHFTVVSWDIFLCEDLDSYLLDLISPRGSCEGLPEIVTKLQTPLTDTEIFSFRKFTSDIPFLIYQLEEDYLCFTVDQLCHCQV